MNLFEIIKKCLFVCLFFKTRQDFLFLTFYLLEKKLKTKLFLKVTPKILITLENLKHIFLAISKYLHPEIFQFCLFLSMARRQCWWGYWEVWVSRLKGPPAAYRGDWQSWSVPWLCPGKKEMGWARREKEPLELH